MFQSYWIYYAVPDHQANRRTRTKKKMLFPFKSEQSRFILHPIKMIYLTVLDTFRLFDKGYWALSHSHVFCWNILRSVWIMWKLEWLQHCILIAIPATSFRWIDFDGKRIGITSSVFAFWWICFAVQYVFDIINSIWWFHIFSVQFHHTRTPRRIETNSFQWNRAIIQISRFHFALRTALNPHCLIILLFNRFFGWVIISGSSFWSKLLQIEGEIRRKHHY